MLKDVPMSIKNRDITKTEQIHGKVAYLGVASCRKSGSDVFWN